LRAFVIATSDENTVPSAMRKSARMSPSSSAMLIVIRVGWLIGSRIMARVWNAAATVWSVIRFTSSTVRLPVRGFLGPIGPMM
jgi:hypothetical protein